MNDGKNASKAYQKTSSSVSLAEFTQLYFSANCIRSETANADQQNGLGGARSNMIVFENAMRVYRKVVSGSSFIIAWWSNFRYFYMCR